MEKQIVIFQLEDEFYGIDIATVESIIKIPPITKMPHTPDFIEGVTNLRGRVLPVMDLRKRFGLSSHVSTKDSRIVVVSMSGMAVGMVVDGVSEVMTVMDSEIEPTPTMVTTVDSTFIIGIAKLEKHLVIMLDLEAVFSKQEMSVLHALPVEG